MQSRSQAATSAAPAQSRLPLSFGQEQLWFLDQFAPGEPTYNVPSVHRLRGPLDVAILHRSLIAVVARHDALRATFHAADGTPFQQVAPAEDVELGIVDLTGVPAEDRQGAFEDALELETGTPFSLDVGPLVRFRLFRLGDDDHVLCLTAHHIVIDGWSMGLLTSEISQTYRALLDDEPGLPALRLRYADYVAWQRAQLSDNRLEEQLQYWERQLAGLAVTELPADRSRPAAQSFRGDGIAVELRPELLQDLHGLGQRQGASLFMLLTAAVNAVIGRYTGQEDIALGVSMLGRTEPELESLIGYVTNMVVLRTDLSGDPTMAELVDRLADASLDVYDNQEVPFEKVVERVQPLRDPSRNPLFQVSVQLLGAANSGNALDLPGVAIDAVIARTTRSRFDMALNFVELNDRLWLSIEYSTDLFDRWRVEAMVRHIENVLAAAVADPSLRLSQLPILSDAEREDLLAAGRGEPLTYDDEPVHVMLAEIAAAHPQKVAAVCNGRELTYEELDRRAGRLARYLRSQGVQRDDVVAIAMERDVDALVALLGVMKAGAAFAVLDTKNPAGRLSFMLKDTGAPVVITQSAIADRLPEPDGWDVVALDTDWELIESTPADEPWEEWATRDSLAYVLYTSGSSGKPKGVLIEHRALMSFVESYKRTFDLCADDRMLQLAALSFDMSQGEIFAGLAVGATLVLVAPDVGSSADALADLMRRERVSYICLSPTMLSLVEAEPYPELRKIMAGGEALPGEVVNKWNLPGRRLVNVYGPTEAAVGCTAYECEHAVWESAPPIGAPYPDRRMYVVDAHENLVPKGVPGELLIGGEEGLARGYLNQPQLTAERFVADPFHAGGRVYRTGDLVRWTPDSQLEFLGRLDSQVKLHGLRIELEEIESVLLAHPLVGMAAVAVRADSGGDRKLVGYVVPANGQVPSTAELRRHLGEEVPEYMVPTAWMILEEFPLTTARKVDRSALPTPERLSVDSEEPFVAPGTPTEERVAEIFAEVLSIPRVGADGHFFELGGSSLPAMRALSRLNRAFGVKLNIRSLYGAATVSAVSAAIDERLQRGSGSLGTDRPGLSRIEAMSSEDAANLPATRGDAGPAGDVTRSLVASESEERGADLSHASGPLVPINATGSRTPLFCVHPVSGSAYAYVAMAGLLDSSRPVYGFEAAGFDNDRRPVGSVPELSTAYLSAIEELRPGGDRCLLGWSMGGVVAFDMAQRSSASGGRVDLVVLIDSPVPERMQMPAERDVLHQFVWDLMQVAGTSIPQLKAIFADQRPDVEPAAAFAAILATGLVPQEIDAEFLQRRYAVFRANVEALYGHQIEGRYDGRVALIRGADSPRSPMRWQEVASDVEEYTVSGDHHSVWTGDGLVELSRIVQRCLDSV